jgi:hypothetical protein
VYGFRGGGWDGLGRCSPAPARTRMEVEHQGNSAATRGYLCSYLC